MVRQTILTALVAVSLGFGIQAATGAPFQNLDFEEPHYNGWVPPTDPGYTASASEALPHWTPVIDTVDGPIYPNWICYNDHGLDSPSISIYDGEEQYPGNPLAGHYSALLFSGSDGSHIIDGTLGAYIFQTGDVPSSPFKLSLLAFL